MSDTVTIEAPTTARMLECCAGIAADGHELTHSTKKMEIAVASDEDCVRRLIQTGDNIQKALAAAPDQWRDIAAKARAALDTLEGDGCDNLVASPWIDAGQMASDSDILLGPGRWLPRGSGAMLIGYTGTGKSTLTATWSFSWAIGRESLGIRPTGRLRSLVFQAEDDAGDLDAMAKSILAELRPSDEELQAIRENVLIITETAITGIDFLRRRVAPALIKFHPDILWLNPLSTYFGSDLNDQREVARFFRNTLNPLLLKHRCLNFNVHHCPKPTKEREGWKGGQLAYSGAGSADLANWAREIITLRETSPGLFELAATKRWRKLGWQDTEGRPTAIRQIAQDRTGGQVWRDATPELLEELGVTPYSVAALLALVPEAGIDRAELIRRGAETFSVTERTAAKYIDGGRREHHRMVNGQTKRCKLFHEMERPRRDVYPDKPSGKPVVWLTKSTADETADEGLMK
jgi:AAA domain